MSNSRQGRIYNDESPITMCLMNSSRTSLFLLYITSIAYIIVYKLFNNREIMKAEISINYLHFHGFNISIYNDLFYRRVFFRYLIKYCFLFFSFISFKEKYIA